MCESFKIPENIRKTGLDHNAVNKSNYLAMRPKWKPYLKLDVVSLAAIVIKYSTIMTDLVDQNMTSNISAPSLTFKGWYSHIAEKEVKVFSHVNPFTRWFIRNAVKGGRVFANKKAFRSPLLDEVIQILQKRSSLQTDSLRTQVNISDLMQW